LNVHSRFAVSIVVPLFNQLAATRSMLDSLLESLQQRDDYDIILVDDGSSDGTREWLDGLRIANLRVLKNESNLGFARAVNRGVRGSTGEIVVLANNDLVFSPNWLEPMLAVICDPALEAGVVGNVQRTIDDAAVDHAGIDIDYRGHLSHIRAVADAGLPYEERFALTGACCMVKRELYERIGGLDEAYFNGGEDIQLCLTAARMGFRNYVALRSVIRHHVSLSRPKASLQDQKNSDLLFNTWSSEFEQRLAFRWLQRMQSGCLTEPSSGADEVQVSGTPLAHVRDLAMATAQSILQRNRRNRQSALGLRASAADYSSITLAGAMRPAGLGQYLHCKGPIQVTLPAGVGGDGFFICGHLYASAYLRSLSFEVWAVLEFNDFQATSLKLQGGDFAVGFHRPVALEDRPATARFRLEARDADSGTLAVIPETAYQDLYLSHMAIDDGRQVQFRSVEIVARR
jgi:GT2 family glycosyltransferase